MSRRWRVLLTDCALDIACSIIIFHITGEWMFVIALGALLALNVVHFHNYNRTPE